MQPAETQLVCEDAALGIPAGLIAKRLGLETTEVESCLRKKGIQHRIDDTKKRLDEEVCLTRKDIIEGIQEAINDAKLVCDSASQIRGWTEIARMLGMYAPEQKELVLDYDARLLLSRIERLSTSELARIAGPSVIDADFWEAIDRTNNATG